jgi:hypothetical protein
MEQALDAAATAVAARCSDRGSIAAIPSEGKHRLKQAP